MTSLVLGSAEWSKKAAKRHAKGAGLTARLRVPSHHSCGLDGRLDRTLSEGSSADFYSLADKRLGNLRSNSMHLSIAFVLGVVFALLLYPTNFLLGSPLYWENVQGDTAINWIAYIAFSHDEWRWPLLHTLLLGPPYGANIYFADPIPLFALLGKLLFKTTGYLPNYFGPWILLSYGFQSSVGYLLLRELRLPRSAALAACVLYLAVPAFIFRIGHLALLAHWVLLLALLVYLRIVHYGRYLDVWLGCGLTTLLVLVNPYLLAMVATIYLAGLGDGVLRRRLESRCALFACALLLASVLGVALLVGLVDSNKTLSAAGGFGYYSMNALSPIWPQQSAWPNMTDVLDATGGQYEGYNYLGAGLLFLLAITLFSAQGEVLEKAKRHIVLASLTLGMTIYSLSSEIYWGNTLIAMLPYDRVWPFDTLTGIFRSSGRFFWPMCYLLVSLIAAGLYLRFGQRRFVPIVLVAAGIQFADIHPLLKNVSESVAAEPLTAKTLINQRSWKTVLQEHDELVVFPRLYCAQPDNHKYVLAVSKLAAAAGIPTNSTFDSRTEADCAGESVTFVRNFRSLATRRNPLVVALKNQMNGAMISEASASAEMVCREADFAYVCSSDPFVASLETLGGNLDPPPTVALGEVVRMGKGDRGSQFLNAGWYEGAADYVWGSGLVSSLAFTTEQAICGPALLSLRIRPFAIPIFTVDRATITINDTIPRTLQLSGPDEMTLNVPFSQSECTSFFAISLEFSDLRSPNSLGLNRDLRFLNWRLFSFTISPLDSDSDPLIAGGARQADGR